MSALNTEETTTLRQVISLIHTVRVEGFRPEHVDGPSITKDAGSEALKPLLAKAEKDIQNIVERKGHYPK